MYMLYIRSMNVNELCAVTRVSVEAEAEAEGEGSGCGR